MTPPARPTRRPMHAATPLLSAHWKVKPDAFPMFLQHVQLRLVSPAPGNNPLDAILRLLEGGAVHHLPVHVFAMRRAVAEATVRTHQRMQPTAVPFIASSYCTLGDFLAVTNYDVPPMACTLSFESAHGARYELTVPVIVRRYERPEDD